MRRITTLILALLSIVATAQDKTDWELFTLAIIEVESNGNEKADDGHGCWGVLQLTGIYVKEVNRLYGTDYRHEDAFSREKSIEMFNLMQNAKNPTHDFKRALDIHNPRHPQSYADKIYKEYNRLRNGRQP